MPTITTKLNTPPAQTWNYLKINDVSVELPQIDGDSLTEDDSQLANIACGCGEGAARWMFQIAANRRTIEIEPGDSEENILVDIDVDQAERSCVDLIVGEGAQVKVLVIAHGQEDEENLSSALLRILCKADSKLELTELVSAGASSTHLSGIGMELEQGAHAEVKQYSLGAGLSSMGLAANLVGSNSSLELALRYMSRKQEKLDVNHAVWQRGTSTKATIDASGVLADHAEKNYRATIDLVQGCKGSAGSEQETVLVWGDDVINRTLPTIMCSEDDVAGDHGATIGSVSAEQIEYLAARGLSQDEAELLIARSVLDDALFHMSNETSREAVLRVARDMLGEEEAAELAETSAALEGAGSNE
ncbi:MAG: SufD family Fe-S cluster assembly protein [Atopobiaceae bacterium]|nr:SufD family Fe-S cluster assembly protein [Atopobiaceae bacterium]